MIYIPHVKKRIDELAPRWRRRALTQKELDELYDLLDEVVIEAREARSDLVHEDQRPEVYLLALLEQRIQNALHAFFRKYESHFLKNKRFL